MLGKIFAPVVIAAGIVVGPAFGQLPDISREFLNLQSRLDGETIRFCVYGASAIGDYDRAVAQLLGDSLLLAVEIHEVEPPISMKGLDSIPISLEDFFILLTNECDGFMGIELAPEVYPDWLTFTRPYLSVPYVAAVREGTYASLDELPAQQPVATQSLTTGDARFNSYMATLPKEQRWLRRPYPSSPLQLENLLDGTVEAAIVWEPWMGRPDSDWSGLEIVPSGSLRLPERSIGIALRIRDTFLRSSLDEAIDQLEADGSFAALYEEIYSSPAPTSQ